MAPCAVIATMLLCATGSAVTALSSPRVVRSVPRFARTRRATELEVTSRATVSTSRVGSLDSRTIGRPTRLSLSRGAGLISRSASAS